ncbi:unnamed protein product, partial [Clonostachys byssicola]
IPP